jgi:hypothetical protein
MSPLLAQSGHWNVGTRSVVSNVSGLCFNFKTVLLRVFDLDQIQDRRARFIVIAWWAAAAFFDPVVFKH